MAASDLVTESQVDSLSAAILAAINADRNARGALAGLTTTDKSSIVAAINEVDAQSSSPPDASETVKGLVELATVAEATTGTDTTRAVTAAGVAAVRAALKAEILGAGVPAALDTLDELAAALADDANFAATTTTALGNRLRVDTAVQGLTGPQQTNALTNLGVARSTSAFGTTFTAGLV